MNLGIALCVASALTGLGQETNKLSEDELLGTWQLVKAQRDGKPFEAYITKLVFIKGGTIEIHEKSNKGNTVVISKFKVRLRGEVKEIDEGDTSADGEPIADRTRDGRLLYRSSGRGIYKIGAGQLTICWQRTGNRPRPKSYETKEGDHAELIVLKRVRPDEEAEE